MYVFKLIPRNERRQLKRIALSFIVLLSLFVILLHFVHDPKPKCKPTPDAKSCQTKE
jgi:hypothetical protein